MMTLEEMAKLWCVYNGQRGTPKQVAKVVKTFEAMPFTLERMLIQRGQIPPKKS